MTITLSAADFVRGVNSVLACASGDRTLPALNVVRIEWDERAVVFAATDRYVMGEQTVERPAPADGEEPRSPGAVSIPLEAVKAVLAILKATAPKGNLLDTREVTIPPVPEWGHASIEGVAFGTPGDFPKYRSLFPHESTQAEIARVLFDVDKLAQRAGPKVKGRRADLECRFTGEVKAICVKRVGDDTFRGLLMPIRPSA